MAVVGKGRPGPSCQRRVLGPVGCALERVLELGGEEVRENYRLWDFAPSGLLGAVLTLTPWRS